MTLPAASQAQDGYTISGLKVEASAASPTEARDQAMQQAAQDAWRQMMARMKPGADPASIPVPPPDALAQAVSGYEVEQEQMTAKGYRATLSVSFDPAQFAALAAQPIPAQAAAPTPSATDASAIPPSPPAPPGADGEERLLILPVLQSESAALLWEENNLWRQAWGGVTEQIPGGRLRLPLGDLEDMRAITGATALSAPPGLLEKLALRHGAQEVILALAEPQAGRLVVRLMHPTQAGAAAESFTVEANAGESLSSQLAKAASQAAGLLYSARSARPAAYVPPSPPQASTVASMAGVPSLHVLVPFRSLSEWQEIRRNLVSQPGVSKVDITAISGGQADVKLYFSTSLQAMQGQLAGAGLSLKQERGYWVLRRNG